MLIINDNTHCVMAQYFLVCTVCKANDVDLYENDGGLQERSFC